MTHLGSRCKDGWESDSGCVLFRGPMNPVVHSILDVRENRSQGLLLSLVHG